MVSIPHPLRGLERPSERVAGSPHTARWIVAGIAIVGLSAMLPVLQKSTQTSRGFTLQQRQAEASQLTNEIHQLEGEVARLTSQERIERRAYQIGLLPSRDAIYVDVSVPGPEPAKIPAEFLPPREPTVEDPAPWWRSLLSWLPFTR
jgi:cell division protein FtsB